MAKIVNLTGEEVVALTAQYMSESDVAIVQKHWITRQKHISHKLGNQASLYHPSYQVAGILQIFILMW